MIFPKARAVKIVATVVCPDAVDVSSAHIAGFPAAQDGGVVRVPLCVKLNAKFDALDAIAVTVPLEDVLASAGAAIEEASIAATTLIFMPRFPFPPH